MTRTPGTYAVIETSEGTIVCRLFEKDAPKTVANFVELDRRQARVDASHDPKKDERSSLPRDYFPSGDSWTS